MEETLVKVLSALFGDRVFPDVAEIDTPVPFCVYRQIGGTPVNTLDGVPADRSRIANTKRNHVPDTGR